MMAKDPNGRYPTPDRAAQTLQVFLAAGAEPARPIETEASMMQYLNWLETGGNRPQPSGGVPVAAAVARPPISAAGSPSGKHKKKRKKHKDKAPVAAGVAPPPPGVVKQGVPLGAFDVELVAVSPGTSAAPPPMIAPPVGVARKKPRRAGRMSRRNFILAQSVSAASWQQWQPAASWPAAVSVPSCTDSAWPATTMTNSGLATLRRSVERRKRFCEASLIGDCLHAHPCPPLRHRRTH